jgi:hypothetical protein
MFLKEKQEEPCTEVDPRKLEELRKQALRTEELANCVISELHGGGSADPEPPTIQDAAADIAYGARLIRKGAGTLKKEC